jgi:hypothetical protein
VTAVLPETRPARPSGPGTERSVVAALARSEARRMLRAPVLWLGVALALAFTWATIRMPDDWAGARYTAAPILAGPLLVCISIVVAGSFHRERVGVAAEAPVGEGLRTAGRLGGALALVGLVSLLTAVGAGLARWHGGFDLGEEPGRTLHAHFTLAEILQQPTLAVLAVAVGAAAGRRLRHRATSTLLLFVGWFPFVTVSWAFMSRHVTPFSVIQIQPVSIPAGPIESDPMSFPSTWLLSAPGEYQDHWAHELVSGSLAAGHDLWLLGLACLFLALAVPRRTRVRLLVAGVLLAGAGVSLQYAVIPS